MVLGDINARGGLLGRHLELVLEDSATDDAIAAAKATKLVQEDGVDVVFGGIYSSTRQAIKGPVVVEGKTLYIYPEQYEGQESDPLIFCTGPVPAQQVDPFIPWLMRETGAKTFYLPSADYIWPHVLNARVREVVTANGGSIVGEEYFALDHTDYRQTVEAIAASGAGRDAVPRGAARLGLHPARRPARLHLLRRELPHNGSGGARRGPLRLPRLLPGRARRVQPHPARAVRRALPG
jgi:branched-chain amino acid transport system substrate-binding protein